MVWSKIVDVRVRGQGRTHLFADTSVRVHRSLITTVVDFQTRAEVVKYHLLFGPGQNWDCMRMSPYQHHIHRIAIRILHRPRSPVVIEQLKTKLLSFYKDQNFHRIQSFCDWLNGP